MRRLAVTCCTALCAVLVACGGGSSNGTPVGGGVPTPTPIPTPTPTPTPKGVVLPTGMVCPAPTPPPMLGLKVTVQAREGNRIRLDSKPIIPNIDHYCEKVGFGDWKFCDTRVEGTSDRVACDYLATGQADNGRWGPNWFVNGKPCGQDPTQCVLHDSEQFLAIGKVTGSNEACASDLVSHDPEGSRCGSIDVQ